MKEKEKKDLSNDDSTERYQRKNGFSQAFFLTNGVDEAMRVLKQAKTK